jgi:inner membrane protein
MESTIQTIWSKSKLLVKALIIGFIILILQIPTFYIKELISEREIRQKEAITEVSNRWAGKQNIAGPVLVLPYWQNSSDSLQSKKSRHYAYFLPDDLKIQAEITPEEKYRGIYKVMLYTSKIKLKGSFEGLTTEKLKIRYEDILWNEAFLKINISDLKGLNDDVKLKWKDQDLELTTDLSSEHTPGNSVFAPLNLTDTNELTHSVFSAEMTISGSRQLLFTPLGRSTTVNVSAKWPHPSFTGNVLPFDTEIKNDSFYAQWKSIAQKRDFPQQWKDNAFGIYNHTDSIQSNQPNNISNSSFGVDLFVPVNDYQKTMRAVKYAALCILLTFAAFFIVETTNKRSMHPFQYGLVGIALVLFYTLLLSFSEYTGFNIAYMIASVSTIGLIAWFVKGMLGSSRLTAILSVVLMLLYTYVFTILQMQDYSLILGSIGLFITLAVIMHFSKKIQW